MPVRQSALNRAPAPCSKCLGLGLMSKAAEGRLSRLSEWSGPVFEAATRTRGYPAWLMVSIKVAVTIALLSVGAAWTMDRSAKAQLAQLAQNAAKAPPSKPVRQR